MIDREALRLIVLEVSANTPGDLISRFRRELIVEKILAAGFRRSEAPEPSDPEGEGSSPWREIQAAKDLLAEAYGPGEWSSEPQGEPSDAIRDADSALVAAVLAYNEERRKQGHMNAGVHHRAMRAALRAAGGVR